MKKKLISMVALLLFLSVPVSTLAASKELAVEKQEIIEVQTYDQNKLEEINKNFEKDGLVDHKLLYSGPIGGDDNLIKPSVPTDGNVINIPIGDDVGFTWTYDERDAGSDKLVKDGYSWLTTAIVGGVGGGISYILVRKFTTEGAKAAAGGAAGSIWGRGTAGMGSTSYTYWDVDEYTDEDSYNMYHKYVVRMYSDKAKTKLKSSWTEVHSDRYR